MKVLALALVIAGLSMPVSNAQEPSRTPAAEIIPGSLGGPRVGLSRIVFYREAIWSGGGYPIDIRMGPDFSAKASCFGVLSAGQYVIVDTPPGTHTFSPRKDGSGGLTFDAETDRAYFVKADFHGMFANPKTTLTLVELEVFQANFRRLESLRDRRCF